MKVIDIHTHGGFGICFDNISEENIKEFQTLAFEKGIIAFCPALTGDSADKLYEKLQIIKSAKENTGKNMAKIIGANLEGTFLNPERAGIQDPKVFLEPNIENFKKITKDLTDIVKIVVVAPEIIKDENFINFIKSKNIKVHFGHTKTNEIKGADGICHLFNAMNPLSHKISTIQTKALIDENIYTEIIADTIHVNKDMLKLTFKIRPKSKIILISDALPIAGSNLEYCTFCGKKIYKNGLDEKGTLGGSIKLLPDIAQNLIKIGLMNEKEVELAAYKNITDYMQLNIN